MSEKVSKWLPTIIIVLAFALSVGIQIAVSAQTYGRLEERVETNAAQLVRNKSHINALENQSGSEAIVLSALQTDEQIEVKYYNLRLCYLK